MSYSQIMENKIKDENIEQQVDMSNDQEKNISEMNSEKIDNSKSEEINQNQQNSTKNTSETTENEKFNFYKEYIQLLVQKSLNQQERTLMMLEMVKDNSKAIKHLQIKKHLNEEVYTESESLIQEIMKNQNNDPIENELRKVESIDKNDIGYIEKIKLILQSIESKNKEQFTNIQKLQQVISKQTALINKFKK